jgi:hypothetical protein
MTTSEEYKAMTISRFNGQISLIFERFPFYGGLYLDISSEGLHVNPSDDEEILYLE